MRNARAQITTSPGIYRTAIIISFMICVQYSLYAQTNKPLLQTLPDQTTLYNKEMVTRFYILNNQQLQWNTGDSNGVLLRKKMITLLDSACYLGLNKFEYHYNELIAACNKTDSSTLKNVDILFTDAALTFTKDVYTGKNIIKWIESDEISSSFTEDDKLFLVNQLLSTSTDSLLQAQVSKLQPSSEEYRLLKKELYNKLQTGDTFSVKLLNISLNILRWINHFKLQQRIIVNIPSANLFYYSGDSIALKMKVVAGKPLTPTPRMTTYCTEVILYPYWNVPRKIAVNELLPLFKLLPKMVDALNMQVIDAKGNVVDHHRLKWTSFNKNNFPYKFRQSTGCDNSLGVVKFNLTNPFDVYLHDTNIKKSFLSDHRFYSHGCIRIEKPIELAGLLLNNALDTTFLQSCLKEQKPVPISIKKKVPVFVVYMPAEIDTCNRAVYYKDVYDLLR